MANHEQDQGSGTGPAGIEARDDEDAGTFRWPSSGLPKLFGRQPAEAEEVPGPGAGGAPPASPPTDWRHALGTAPPAEPDDAPGLYRAPFGQATYGYSPALTPEAGEAGEDEQPPWPPAPPPGQYPPQGPVPPPAREPVDAAQPGMQPGPPREPNPQSQPGPRSEPSPRRQRILWSGPNARRHRTRPKARCRRGSRTGGALNLQGRWNPRRRSNLQGQR